MGTVVDKFYAVITSIDNIKKKINEKGVVVEDSTPLSQYADKIGEIGSGSKIITDSNAKVLQSVTSTSALAKSQPIINTATAEITES